MTTKRGRADPGRSLTTVLFTDIVGSTEMAAAVGDAAWKSLLARYYAMVRGRLVRFGGREIDTAGDGLFASFPAPAEAVRCAHSIRAGASELGITVRSGLHVGETETIEGKVGGIAVHIGARIAAAAGPNEVLVSGTVKDLVEGSGLRFEDRGEATLKGVPGTRRLYLSVPEPIADTQAHTAVASPAAAARKGLRGRPSRSRWVVIATGEVVVLVVVACLLLLPGSTGPAPPAPASPSATPGGPAAVAVGADMVASVGDGGTVSSAVQVGGEPGGVAFSDDGSVWVTSTTDATVSRLDQAGATVVQTIHGLGPSPTGIAFGHGAIWVADSGGRTVSRINPATNTVVKQYTVGNAPSGIAATDKGVWVANRLDGTVAELDPDAGTVIRTVPVGLSPIGVASGAGSIWVSDFDGATVSRVDPADGSVDAVVKVGNGASAIAASDHAIWVVNRRDDSVSRIDPTTDQVAVTVPIDGEPDGIALGPDRLWVAVPSASSLTELDPTSGQVLGRVTVAASPEAVAVRDGRPFFTTDPTEPSHRGGTLRVASDKDTLPSGVDPTYAPIEDVTGGRLFLTTNDGLIAYRRVGGADGQQLVSDLATSIPSPTDGGLTYRFQLRSGITYSDGEPLRASDVLRTAAREFVAASSTGINPFSGIVGATAACAQPGAAGANGASTSPSATADASVPPASACDLAGGIVVDDSAGTVTFHLKAPDPYFLYNLAQPWAFILPSSTPVARSATPLPATGPYEFDRIDSTSIHLKRNPRFQAWSIDAQPDGFPDAIEWDVDPDPIGAVIAGRADWTPDPLTTTQLSTIETTLTDQLHIAASTETWFEMLNTKRAPFDKLEVREALNLATDRAAVAEAFGGGRVTCQVIPPGFAGYAPYCPYTADGDASQTWRGPDLPAARALIKKAGVAGEAVTVWGLKGQGHAQVAEYFVKLLDSLGFRAKAHLEDADAFFTGLGSPTSGVATSQVAGYWASSPIASGAAEFPGFFTCPGFPTDTSPGYPNHFCDPAIDQEVAAGLALEQEGDPDSHAKANAIWVKVDRQIVDAAPAVMPFNPVDVDLLSKRTGGFQHHPFWNILLDQLWVQ